MHPNHDSSGRICLEENIAGPPALSHVLTTTTALSARLYRSHSLWAYSRLDRRWEHKLCGQHVPTALAPGAHMQRATASRNVFLSMYISTQAVHLRLDHAAAHSHVHDI
jgi:hypothetical protein